MKQAAFRSFLRLLPVVVFSWVFGSGPALADQYHVPQPPGQPMVLENPVEPSMRTLQPASPYGTLRQAQSSPGAKANGFYCSRNEECKSGYCADGRRCAPVDGTGKGANNDYCHHDNHCESKRCICPEGHGYAGFCKDWESWPEGANKVSTGFCADQVAYGESCNRNSDCIKGQCANGRRCAPWDGKGMQGDYCHHDNHCASGQCQCPGAKSWGFCANWENYRQADLTRERQRGNFSCP